MSEESEFDVELHAHPDDVLIVDLAGELDAAEASWVEDTLAAAAPHHRSMLVRLQKVTFLDSAGIRTLQTLQGRAKILGLSLSFDEPSNAVLRTLSAAGLVELLQHGDPAGE